LAQDVPLTEGLAVAFGKAADRVVNLDIEGAPVVLLQRVDLGDGQPVALIVAAEPLKHFSDRLGEERDVGIQRALDSLWWQTNFYSQHRLIRELAKLGKFARWSIAAPEDDAELLKGHRGLKATLPLVEEVLQTADKAG
jgi:hypothetical protein